MKHSNVLKVYLTISGILLTVIGGSTLLMPIKMKASAGIDIAGNISVINDVRAASALILAMAIIILLGAFKKTLTYTSTILAFTLFWSLGVGRLISIWIDGLPVDGLVKATGLEFILGILGLILFIKNKEK